MNRIRPGVEFEAKGAVVPNESHPFWTLKRISDSLADIRSTGIWFDDRPVSGISTDTRTIKRGDAFIALRGEKYDGHDMLTIAVENGAALLIVDDARRASNAGVPVIEVSDTLKALGLLANTWRRVWAGIVVAVGGSNGKTGTKEMLKGALASHYSVYATKKNENNLIGVPLTLLSVPPYSQIAIVETGTNSPGEIAALKNICEPDIAVITSIGEEHLEGLKDMDGVIKEESSLLNGVSDVVVPSSSPEIVSIARAIAKNVHVAPVGIDEKGVLSWSLDGEGSVCLKDADGKELSVLGFRGVHSASNAMVATTVCSILGLSAEQIAISMASARPPDMRSEIVRMGRSTLINDAYNSNPPSALAALALIASMDSERQKVVILGTMRELGSSSDTMHDKVARAALDLDIDLIVGIGAFGDAFSRIAPENEKILKATDPISAWQAVESHLSSDAIVLLKASRGVKLEQIIPLISNWATN